MTGTLLNVVAVLIGGGLGMLFGARLPGRLRATLLATLGLFTLALGLRMFLQTSNPLIPLASLVVGAFLGEGWRIEDGLRTVGARLEARFAGGSGEVSEGNRFIRGFLTASLLFCVGPMTILGSIQDGISGDYQLLAIKSVLDGIASLAFASTLGAGVLFSVLVIFLYQGGLTLLASQAQAFLSDAMIAEMTAVGGVLLMALAVSSLLEVKPIRTGNLLPALIAAPLFVWLFTLLGIA